MMKSILLATLICSCVADDSDPTTTPSSYALGLPPAEAANMLAVVNYPGTDLDVLDKTIGLDARAAKNIVAARDGVDGISPSADDVAFTTVAALDAVPYVGDAAFQKLVAYATAHPAPVGETVEGVAFAGWQVEAVTWGANTATQDELNALLDSRAVTALLAKRTFTTVTQIGAVSYVGGAALGKLRDHAQAWWNQKHGSLDLAGRFDGAVFDEAEAEIAIDIANRATLAQFTAHTMSSPAASAIIGNRPYTTLAQVSAVGGVGSATMNALLVYAKSGQWGSATCIATFDSAVSPVLGDLLFLSESDRPFDIVSFPGAGTSAPTGASVLALVGAPAGSTAEVRAVDNYFVDFEPEGTSAMTVQTAITSQLTDLIYVAVHAPAGSVDDALVDVYLVGRTTCGDLVGLHSISVET